MKIELTNEEALVLFERTKKMVKYPLK